MSQIIESYSLNFGNKDALNPVGQDRSADRGRESQEVERIMALPAVRSLNSLAQWDPFRELDGFFTQVSRNAVWSPLADVTETDTAYVFELDLPGVRREDVTVDLNGTTLSITGELKEREDKGLFHRRTRRTGKFAYRVTLPRTVNADNVEAKLADGVLTVSVAKTEAAKPRRIEITA